MVLKQEALLVGPAVALGEPATERRTGKIAEGFNHGLRNTQKCVRTFMPVLMIGLAEAGGLDAYIGAVPDFIEAGADENCLFVFPLEAEGFT